MCGHLPPTPVPHCTATGSCPLVGTDSLLVSAAHLVAQGHSGHILTPAGCGWHMRGWGADLVLHILSPGASCRGWGTASPSWLEWEQT